MARFSQDEIRALYPPVPRDANKYSRGVVGVVAGSHEYPGAALLTLGAARRGGAGYVKYLANDPEVNLLVIQEFPDVVISPSLLRLLEKLDAVVLGPGNPDLSMMDLGTLRHLTLPVILDGGALELATSPHSPFTIVTPHAGEIRRLGYEIQDERLREAMALQIASDLEVIVVLKGVNTVVASPTGATYLDEIGGIELATAGTGDILAGLLGSMCAAWKPHTLEELFAVVTRTVTLHSMIGVNASEKFHPVVATDLLRVLVELDASESEKL